MDITGTIKELVGAPVGKWLENLSEVSDKYLNLEKVVTSVNDALTYQASELRKLNKELGGGSKTVAKFRYEIANLSKEIGVNIRDVTELIDTTKEYHQGITRSTASTLKFVKAVGVMPTHLGEMTAKLNIMGSVSEESLTKMYENLLAVRGAYGLTSEQIDDVINLTTRYAIATQATDKQLEQATLTLSKFVSQLTTAGMESEKVTELLNSMIDPDQLTDNLVLMSKLGITVEDMISGDPTTKLEGATEKMKQLGQEIMAIAENNRFQANEMAKVYGLTLEDARSLANIDTEDKAINTQKSLDQYRGEMMTFTESIHALTDKIGGALAKPLSIVGDIIQRLTDTLAIVPRGLMSVIVGIGAKKLLNKLSDWLGEAAVKFGKKITEPMKDYLDKVGLRGDRKQEDIKKLTPKTAKDLGIDYGFGFNQNIRRERKAMEKAQMRKRGMGDLTDGEKLETIQKMYDERIAGRERYRNELKTRADSGDKAAIKELAIFERMFGVEIDTFNNNFGKLIKGMEDKANTGWTRNGRQNADLENLKSYSKMKQREKRDAFSEINSQLGNFGVKDTAGLGIGDGEGKFDRQIAEIASTTKGPKELLDKLKEFWEASSDPEAPKHLAKVNEEIKNVNDNVVESAGGLEQYAESMKAVNEAAESGKKGIKLGDRIGNFLQGNIKKIFAGFGIGTGISILSKIASAAMKSEGAQEKITALTEQVSGVVNNIFDAFGPAIQGVIDFVTSIFGLLKGPISWLTEKIGGIAKSVGTGLSSIAGKISNSVSAIEDSYKEEDLKTMVGGYQGSYNTDSDQIIIGVLNKIAGTVDAVKTSQKERNEIETIKSINNNGKN